MTTIKALIFDMDGLLFDTEEIYCQANLAMAPQFGLTGYDRDYYARYIGVSDEESKRMYYRDFAAVGQGVIDDFIAASYAQVRELYRRSGAPLKPGAKELLAYLKQQEIPAIVASSNNREFVDLLLERGGIADYFIGSISGDDVSRAKPDPEIVLKAVAQLGVAPDSCLMLEDSLNGIKASHAAGVPVVMVPDLIAPNAEAEAKCLAIVASLLDVPALLEKNK